MIKMHSFTFGGRGHTLWMLLALIMASCTLGDATVVSSGSLRALIDQPADGYTLPLAPYTIVAHARQDGGGVTAINFMVNDTLLGSVPTNAGEELTSASLEWNPSVQGWYRIQAVAVNNAGQQALSEVSLICISKDPNGDCSEVAGTGETTSGAVDSSITVGAAPDPASIGDSCNPADRIVTFEAFIPDTTGAIEIYIEGNLVGASGERFPFIILLSPGATVGSYIGTLDLETLYDGILAGVDGTLEYRVGLLDKNKEFFKVSKSQTLAVHFCGATPLEGMVKVGGVPSPVYIGKCTPSTIDFEAGTDIDPAMFDHVDFAYVWFDVTDRWIGTVGEENRAEMTPSADGGHWYRLDVNTAPAAMSGGGSIKFRAIVVNTDAADVAYSEVGAIQILPCGATVPVTATSTIYQQPVPGVTPSKTLPPPPPSCSTYNYNYDGCKAAGCYYWSDNTCRDNEEPPPPPPSCSTYNYNPDGCKNAGYCYYWWSDNSCREDPEPPPPDCSSYKTQEDCQAAKCTWDEKLGACSP